MKQCFLFHCLSQREHIIEAGGFPSFRITPPEPVGPCNYLDVRKGQSTGSYFLRFNIMFYDGTRKKYHSESVNEEDLEKMLRAFMDRSVLPYVNRWTAETAEN